ncbi:acyl-CoA carboxylase subunit epsilon [Microbacterium capsulatum]|uniref:Acyl-CoA carboxylase subunit epsilon n=1 Tax=Microbacterium capsulatum TaxID=3041921 RepID=A0ABU0XH86_9MICO|nr:acyl-CoA carboxylase subunit epsilon [Microbacterium sp. ASV81]MDQ4214502.1 acyl-CoA carboxylase subunit epsilon [Microbacterium sp. ASV81]
MSAEESAEPIEIQVRSGHATEEELAALMAVLSEAFVAEEAGTLAAERHVSVWSRGQRGLRAPLRRDIPWGRFSG